MASVKSVRALARGLDVMAELRSHPGATLADLHRGTGLAKATLLRLLKTLEEKGWVYCALADGSYWLGTPIRDAASGVHRQTELAEVASPVLEELCHEVVWPSDFAVCDGHCMTIMETSRKVSPFLVNRDVFKIRPHMLRSALGRAYISFCPEDERDEILARLRRSQTDEDKIARKKAWVSRMIDETRERGYGIREMGYWAGLRPLGNDISAIATPVRMSGGIAGCVNLLWVAGAINTEDIVARYLPKLQNAADEIAARLCETDISPREEK